MCVWLGVEELASGDCGCTRMRVHARARTHMRVCLSSLIAYVRAVDAHSPHIKYFNTHPLSKVVHICCSRMMQLLPKSSLKVARELSKDY